MFWRMISCVPITVKVKNPRKSTYTPPHIFVSWSLIKHGGNSNLTLSHSLTNTRKAKGFVISPKGYLMLINYHVFFFLPSRPLSLPVPLFFSLIRHRNFLCHAFTRHVVTTVDKTRRLLLDSFNLGVMLVTFNNNYSMLEQM